MSRMTQPAASRLITDRMRPGRPGTWPKYSAVAQPRAKEAERLSACQTTIRTTGRNGMPVWDASLVPPGPGRRLRADQSRASGRTVMTASTRPSHSSRGASQ